MSKYSCEYLSFYCGRSVIGAIDLVWEHIHRGVGPQELFILFLRQSHFLGPGHFHQTRLACQTLGDLPDSTLPWSGRFLRVKWLTHVTDGCLTLKLACFSKVVCHFISFFGQKYIKDVIPPNTCTVNYFIPFSQFNSAGAEMSA